MILITFLYMLLASTFTLGKLVLQHSEPIFFVAVRLVISGVLLLGYQYFFDRSNWRFDKKDWFLFLQILLFHIYFAYVLEFWALSRDISSAKVSLFYNLSPFITALFAYIMINERLTTKKWIGLVGGFLAFFPVLMAPAQEGVAFFFLSWPEIAMILSVIAASYGWIVMIQLMKNNKYTPVMINGVGMLSGGVVSFVSSLLIEGKPVITGSLSMFMVYTLALVVLANVIFYNLYGLLLKKYSATFLSFAGFTCPLWAAFFGWYFLGETITWDFYISLILVSGSLYLFYQEELRGN